MLSFARKTLSNYQRNQRNSKAVVAAVAPMVAAVYRKMSGNRAVGGPVSQKWRPTKKSQTRKKGSRKRKAATKKQFKKAVTKVIQNKELKEKAVGKYSKYYGLEMVGDLNADQRSRLIYGGTRWSNNAAPFTLYPCAFTPHSVSKILDAASVMFNGKAVGFDHSAILNNMDTQRAKLDVSYASYSLTFKNITQISYDYEIYEITNKTTKFEDFIYVATNLMQAQKWIGNSLVMNGTIPDVSIIGGKNAATCPINFEFSMIEGLSQMYKWKKVNSGALHPGMSANYFSSRSNFVVDTSKFSDPDFGIAPTLGSHCKGDKQLMIRLQPQMMNIYDAGGSGSTRRTRDNNTAYAIVCEGKENYKILCPDNADDTKSNDVQVIFADNAQQATPVGLATVLEPYVNAVTRINPIV
jgi:hypothetical protein